MIEEAFWRDHLPVFSGMDGSENEQVVEFDQFHLQLVIQLSADNNQDKDEHKWTGRQ